MAGWSEFYAKKNLSKRSADMPKRERVKLTGAEYRELQALKAEQPDKTASEVAEMEYKAWEKAARGSSRIVAEGAIRLDDSRIRFPKACNPDDPCFGCRCNCAKGEECEEKAEYSANREKRNAESYA